MRNIRDWIDLMEAAGYVPPPPTYDSEDDEHYDALDKTGFFGAQAAGCVFLARSTGRLMLMLRSYQVLEPGTWGNCGGAHKASEQPIAAAEREGREETGYSAAMDMVPLLVFTKGDFRYSNFLAVVDEEFEPDLGWEAEDHEWVEFGEWPQPLHFGMKALFSDAVSVAKIKELIAA